MWLYELVSVSGIALAELTARNRTLSLVRNDAGSATFSLTLTEAAALLEELAVGEVDLRISRNGVALFRGPILGAQAELADVGGSVTFTAVGIWALFADRYTDAPVEYLATEQSTLAWSLIAASQARPNGNVGLVSGSLPVTKALDRVEFQTPTAIKSAVEGLANTALGFDFEVVPTGTGWTFNVYAVQGSNRGLVLERGRNLRGQGGVTFDAGPGRLVNHARAIGAGGYYVDAENAASQIRFRRREAVVTADGQDTAANAVLSYRAEAALVPTVRPLPRLALMPGSPDSTLDHVAIGDVVRVVYREGWLRLDGEYRVEAIEANPDAGEPEALTLSVSPHP